MMGGTDRPTTSRRGAEASLAIEAQIPEHPIRLAKSQPAYAKKLENSERPIYRLPTELLIAIIQAALPLPNIQRIKSYYNALQRLRTVSSRLASIIDCTPSLWSLLSTQFGSKVFTFILKHSSKGGKLAAEIDWKASQRPSIKEQISPEMHRFESLTLVYNRESFGWVSFKTMFDSPMPNLVYLGLHRWEWLSDEDDRIISGQLPIPEEYHLSIAEYAPNLRHLSMQAVRWLDLDLLKSAFLGLSALESLEIIDTPLHRGLSEMGSVVIHLPQLRSLLLSGEHTPTPDTFQYPASTRVTVTTANIPSFYAAEFMQPIHQQVRDLDTGSEVMEVSLTATEKTTSISWNNQISLVVDWIEGYYSREQDRSTLLYNIMSPCMRPVHTTANISAEYERSIMMIEAMDQAFPNLTRLSINNEDAASHLMSTTWLLPELEELQVCGVALFEDNFESARDRLNEPTVKPLRVVELKNGRIRRSTLEEIKACVPKVELIGVDIIEVS